MRHFLAALLFFISFAAHAVDWFQQPGSYFKYDTTPTRTTEKVYKHLLTTNLEVPLAWVKQPGTYTQYKSSGGAYTYKLDVVPVDASPCKGAYKCRDATGAYYDMTQNFALRCPAVKLVADEYLDFDAVISVNGQPQCPN
jgi:hypothetical protein